MALGCTAALLALLAVALAPQATAAEIVGRASVIDGDTIEIRDQRIRLYGIDAPESTQRCDLDGEAYLCGQTAAFVLADRIGGRAVACEERDRDRYGRIVAVCSAGGEDLNGFMVRNGWALAYRQYADDYVAAESSARHARLGLWRGPFTPPWDWRRERRSVAQTTAPSAPDCAIKGNIGRSGERLYHLPGGRWYGRTRIDERRGERWFCSEAEAQAAGWRRAGG